MTSDRDALGEDIKRRWELSWRRWVQRDDPDESNLFAAFMVDVRAALAALARRREVAEVPPAVVAQLEAEAVEPREPSVWAFREAENANDLTRWTRFPGSFYDQYGSRLGVIGTKDIERITAALNVTPPPPPSDAEGPR